MRYSTRLAVCAMMAAVVLTLAGCCTPRAARCASDPKVATCAADQVQRFGMVIGVKPEMIDRYKELHANPWPEVIRKIKECNIRNYSIFLAEVDPGRHMLFGYLEYTGTDWDGDMAKMADDTMTVKWWKETDPCQMPLETRGDDRWWMNMEEVFHCK